MRRGFAEADERRTVNLTEQNPHEKFIGTSNFLNPFLLSVMELLIISIQNDEAVGHLFEKVQELVKFHDWVKNQTL